MKSYFYDGTAHGDAIEAPYGAELFSSLIAGTYAPTKNCVIWNTSQNSLRVDGTAGKVVNVNTGTAFIQGIIYTNTAVVNVPVPDNTTLYPRVDAVVVRFVAEDNEARIALKNGIPASNPLPPDIKDNELVLAYLYLAASFATVPSTVVYDKREFAYNSDHVNYFYTDNTMINSEFISFNGLSGAYLYAPDYWTETGTVYFYSEDKFDLQARGRSIRIIADAAGEGMTTTLLSTEGTAKMFTIAILLKVISGVLQVTWAGTSKLYYPSSEAQIVYIRVSTNGYQTLSFLSSGAAAEFQIGQITLTQGYIPAPFEARSEVLFPTNYNTYSVTRNSLSTGATYIDYSTDITQYIKAVIIQIRARDSGSAGSSTCRLTLGREGAGVMSYATLWLAGETNDTYKQTFGIAKLESERLWLDVYATGAGTMDAIIYFTGIIV